MKKKNTIRGRAAKRKGSRAEIQVRNTLRKIYPVELRERVYRVPLSGAGAMKCDVYDGNDPDSAYEVKCQETLCLPDWWRQAKSQSGSYRTPILVITQAYRPFYYIMRKKDWFSLLEATLYIGICTSEVFNGSKNLFERLSAKTYTEYSELSIDCDECVIISEELYIKVKTSIFEDKMLQSNKN